MAEEEEAEGEEVAEIKAELITKGKRRNLIAMMTTMVSSTSFRASVFGLIAKSSWVVTVNHVASTLCFSSSTCSPKESARRR